MTLYSSLILNLGSNLWDFKDLCKWGCPSWDERREGTSLSRDNWKVLSSNFMFPSHFFLWMTWKWSHPNEMEVHPLRPKILGWNKVHLINIIYTSISFTKIFLHLYFCIKVTQLSWMNIHEIHEFPMCEWMKFCWWIWKIFMNEKWTFVK